MSSHSQNPASSWHGSRLTGGNDADKGSPESSGQLYIAWDTGLLYKASNDSTPVWEQMGAWLHNLTATSDPTATDDVGDGYAAGSLWLNTTSGALFVCTDNTSSAAVWDQINSNSVTGVGARVHMSATQAIGASSGLTTVQLDTEEFDTDSAYNTGTYQFTAPSDGLYLVTFGFNVSGSWGSAGSFVFEIAINGSATGQFLAKFNASTTFTTHLGFSDALQLSAGDTVEIQVNNLHASTGITINYGAFGIVKVGN